MMKVYNNAIPNWIVTPTFWCATNLFTFLFMMFCALSYFFYHEANKLNEVIIRYDDICADKQGTGEPCYVDIPLDRDLKNPKLYYRLDKFFINHRSFAKSRYYAQLRGDELGTERIIEKYCTVVKTNDELLKDDWIQKNSDAFPLIAANDIAGKGDQIPWPCGVIPKYIFTDEFLEIKDIDGQHFHVTINDANIAHEIDTDSKFKRNKEAWDNGRYWIDVEDQHLMVWYQMETKADFYKLYGSVDGTMRADHTYQIKIIDRFNAQEIGNKKYIVLSELSTFGGTNQWLAYHFGLAAVLILCILIFFFVMYFVKLHKRNRDTEAFINSLTY